MRALAIAATGMNAQNQNLEVIANNIANINTTGFKRSRAEFTDLIYQTDRLMGVSSRGRDSTVPGYARCAPPRCAPCISRARSPAPAIRSISR
jgi:flagellar hook-basal body protein